MTPTYRGRFAPSPTGPLHLGSVVAALASYADARHGGGEWLIRIEDLDPPREQAGARQQILATLDALGLCSDDDILLQSQRLPIYHDVVERLLMSGAAFECRCSRTDLSPTAGIHRGACLSQETTGPAAVRLRVPDLHVDFRDRIQGPQSQNLLDAVGDFVLRRREGLIAYQLAVVIDDAQQGITHVVRGSDLLDSTARQIYLQSVLGLPTPSYAHIPVLVDASGAKLSKQNLAPAIDAHAALSTLTRAGGILQPSLAIEAETEIAGWLTAFAKAWRIEAVPAFASLPERR